MTDILWSRPGVGRDFQLIRRVAGWVVIDDENRVHSGPHLMRTVAERARRDLQQKRNAAAKVGPRPCITCSRTFDSEGIHHRMCNICRHHSEAFNGTASVAQRGARRVAKS